MCSSSTQLQYSVEEEKADGGIDCSQGMEIVSSTGDHLCSGQVQAVRHLEDTESDVTEVFSEKEDVRESVQATGGDITEMFSQKEDMRVAVDGTEGDIAEVFSQKEDMRVSVDAAEGDITAMFSQKEDMRVSVDATEEDITEVFSQKEDMRVSVEAAEGDITAMFSQKKDIREAVDTAADIEDLLSPKKESCDILDIDCTQQVESDNMITFRETDELHSSNHIHLAVAEVELLSKVQVSSNKNVFSQNKIDDTVPGVCVLKEGVTMANEDITDFNEPTGENNATEAVHVPPVRCGFGNIGKTECEKEATLLNEDVEYCKDVKQYLVPQQPSGGCSTDTCSTGVPGMSGIAGAWSDQQGQYMKAVAERKTGVLDESYKHSLNTLKQILIVSSLDSDCFLGTDDQHAADQNNGNSECHVKPVACGADGDDCAVGGEEETSTESASNEADVCVGIPFGANATVSPEHLGDIQVVCEDSQPHFDLSDTFNMFAEEEHFVTENNDQCISSQEVLSVVNVRQNAVSARAKKRKKEKAKLEKLLSRNTPSSAARARRYAASFQELLANKEDTFHPDFTCPVCLDLYHKPHVVNPCQHMFCEPCLRKLPSSALADNAVCPLCRQDIQACVMDVDLHIQLSEYYNVIYTKRARQEKKLKTNQKPLPRIQTRPLSQQLIRHILSNQSNRRTDRNVLHMVLSVCLSAVLSVLYAWMNVPIEITTGPLRNAAVSNVWVQAICLFCAFTWLFVKVLGKLTIRERR